MWLVPTASAQSLSWGWTATNIGSPALSGSASFNGSVFSVNAGGTDIAGTSDQFVFTYRSLTGDGDVVARVNSLTATNAWAKAGVMIRASLASNAQHVYVATSPSSGAAMQYRSATGGTTTNVSSNGGGAPMWLKIERRGSTFRTFRSADGATWQMIGTANVNLPATASVGIAVTSHNVSQRTTAQVSGVTVAPAGWSASDIGGFRQGNTWMSYGRWVAHAGGSGLGSTSDQFRYVYRQYSGDIDVVSLLSSLQEVAPGTRGGLMIRGSLTANSSHASMMVSAGSGLAFQRRRSTGTSTVSTNLRAADAPVWMRMQRRGSTVTVFDSADGVTWRQLASDTITLPPVFYVGLAGASTTSGVASMMWSDTEITSAGAPTPQPPTVSLTSPSAGAAFTAPASVTVSANAVDSDGTVARVEFRAGSTAIGSDTTSPYSVNWTNVPAGTYTLTAVATDNSGASTTSSPVTVTVGSATNQPPTVSITAPASGTSYLSPASMTLSAAASDSNGSVVRVEFRAGSTLIGSDTSSPFTYQWNNVPAGNYSITAVATDNGGATTTSAPISITVGTATNQPPVVSLTSPTDGSLFNPLSLISVGATASDADGSITRVEFYAGSLLIGADTTSPYAATWLNLPLGTFSLMAVAYDNAGGVTSSSHRTITIAQSTGSASAVFAPSPDHATVSGYVLDVFLATVDPNVAIPLATRNLGKPAIVNGEIAVDIWPVLEQLPAGSYVATVSAVSGGGTGRSAPSGIFTR